MNALNAVFRKELKDASRDRRSILASVAFAVFGPLLVAGVMTVTVEKRTVAEDIHVQASGLEHAPDLVDFLASRQVVWDDESRVHLEIPEDYARRYMEGQPVKLVVSADRSRTSLARDAERLEMLISAYSADLGALRLMLRGISPVLTQPLTIERRDESSREARASVILSLLGIYFLLAAFIGSMAVAIDTSAGERERNSLEVLMAQPVSSLAVFSGKWLTATVFGLLGIALVLIASKIAFTFVPLARIGVSFSIDLETGLLMLASLVPLAGLAAALQLCLAMWAKTYKEASSYLSMLSFAPAVVAMIVVVQEIEPETWMFGIPLLGHQQILNQLMRAEAVGIGPMALLVVSTVAFTAIAIAFGSRLLTQEKIVFGQLD